MQEPTAMSIKPVYAKMASILRFLIMEDFKTHFRIKKIGDSMSSLSNGNIYKLGGNIHVYSVCCSSIWFLVQFGFSIVLFYANI